VPFEPPSIRRIAACWFALAALFVTGRSAHAAQAHIPEPAIVARLHVTIREHGSTVEWRLACTRRSPSAACHEAPSLLRIARTPQRRCLQVWAGSRSAEIIGIVDDTHVLIHLDAGNSCAVERWLELRHLLDPPR
jgi:hypothetical protein